jgi:hypothetical protein
LWAPVGQCASERVYGGRRQPKELWVDVLVGGRGVNLYQWL